MIEIDDGRFLPRHLGGIDDDLLRIRVVRGLDRHHQLAGLGEELAVLEIHMIVADAGGVGELLDALEDGFAGRQLVEGVTGKAALGVDPLAHRRIAGILQPAVRIDDLDAMMFVDDRLFRGLRQNGGATLLRRCAQSKKDDKA